MVGFFLTLYVLIPVAYWTDSYDAKTFPIFSSHVFDNLGQQYDVDRVLNSTDFKFDKQGYDGYSKVNLSIFFVYAYGLSFAVLAATLSHVALFHGRYDFNLFDGMKFESFLLNVIVALFAMFRTIWSQTRASFRDKFGDVHTRIMRKNYEQVPQWWFYAILVVMIGLAFLTCEGFNKQLQLPYWGVILAVALALVFTLPIGVITATTNQVHSKFKYLE